MKQNNKIKGLITAFFATPNAPVAAVCYAPMSGPVPFVLPKCDAAFSARGAQELATWRNAAFRVGLVAHPMQRLAMFANEVKTNDPKRLFVDDSVADIMRLLIHGELIDSRVRAQMPLFYHEGSIEVDFLIKWGPEGADLLGKRLGVAVDLVAPLPALPEVPQLDKPALRKYRNMMREDFYFFEDTAATTHVIAI